MFIKFEMLAMLILGIAALTQVFIPILRSQPLFPLLRKARPTEEKRVRRAQERLLLAQRELEAARAEAQAVELEMAARKLREQNLAKMIGEEVAAADAPAETTPEKINETPAEGEQPQPRRGLHAVGEGEGKQ